MTQTRQVAEALYKAFTQGDADGMLFLFDEDIDLRFLGQAHVRGKDAARHFLKFAGPLLSNVDFTLEALVVDGDVAAGIWHETALTAGGEPWTNHGVDVVHVRDGRIVGLHENNDVRAVYRHFPRYQGPTGR